MNETIDKKVDLINNNKLVVKHNKLIEFKGKMTVNELKLFSLIIADVREQQDKQFHEYYIDISVLEETTKDKNFYNYIKEIALKLEDKRIVVEGFNEENKKYFTTIRLINKTRYTEGSKKLIIEIDKDLIPYIIDLKREFTRYEIENILKLNSSYAVRIYELLKQYETIGKREIDIDDLRKYLGIQKDEYKRFSNFETRVLKVAKAEINGEEDEDGYKRIGTDIVIDYEKVKTGRKITSIAFSIRPKDLENREYIKHLKEIYNLAELKEQMGLSKENFTISQVIKIYELAIIKTSDVDIDEFQYIRLNYEEMIRRGTSRNNFSYLMSALENDYAAAVVQLSYLE